MHRGGGPLSLFHSGGGSGEGWTLKCKSGRCIVAFNRMDGAERDSGAVKMEQISEVADAAAPLTPSEKSKPCSEGDG